MPLRTNYAPRQRKQLGIECQIAPRPVSTLHLIQTLQRYSGIIAARMHATIIANSYRIPSIGLGLGSKNQSIFPGYRAGGKLV